MQTLGGKKCKPQTITAFILFLSFCVCVCEYVNVCFGGSRRPRRGIFVFFRVGFFFAFVRLLRFAFHHCAKGEI